MFFPQEKVQRHWRNLEPLSPTRVLSGNEYLREGNVNMLCLRINNPLCKFTGFPEATLEEDQINNVDISSAESITIPNKEKLPSYTTWVYVARCVWLSGFKNLISAQIVVQYNFCHWQKLQASSIVFSFKIENIIDKFVCRLYFLFFKIFHTEQKWENGWRSIGHRKISNVLWPK